MRSLLSQITIPYSIWNLFENCVSLFFYNSFFFENFSSLTSITLHSSINSIKERSFSNCVSLKQVGGYQKCIDTCNNKFVKIIQFLFDQNADPNQPDELGRYPLEYALYIKSHSYVKALIYSKKIGFTIKIHGETYHHLASKSSKKILKLIHDQNLIDINKTDDSADTPYAIAMKSNHIHNAHLLERRANPDNKSNILSSSPNSDDYDEEDGEILSRILDLLV